MNEYRSKSKWNSQRVSKRFKNRHTNDYESKYCYNRRPVKYDVNAEIDRYMKYSQFEDDTYYTNHSRKQFTWNCPRCTFENNENDSHCNICQSPFNSNSSIKNTTTVNYNTYTTMGEYLEPILNQIETKQDNVDEQLQIAIALSLKDTATDSDATDDTSSTTTTTTSTSSTSSSSRSTSATSTSSRSTSSKSKRSTTKRRKRRNKQQGTSFAAYWQEMREYHQSFQKNLKYIIEENKKKAAKKKKKSLWPGRGHVSNELFELLTKYPKVMQAVPTYTQIYLLLRRRYDIKQFKLKNIMTHKVLHKFVSNGWVNRSLQVVYHGTRSCVVNSIISKGLIVGGTKGVPITTGAAYGNGVYCSPSLCTASSYERGAMFICLVRSERCKRSGTIYVVPNDADILPLYCASFAYNGYDEYFIGGNQLIQFQPGWHPLNLDTKFQKQRRVRRKWNAYYKLQN